MSDKKANCFNCKWRGGVIGSVHSSCKHPDLKGTTNNLDAVMAIFASVGRADPVIDIQAISDKFQIKANYHGIKKGWFNWPWNFDPVWLENCNAFEVKEE
jgi:hypothetical protein